jgi:uncharacterized protein (UPF0179 family)
VGDFDPRLEEEAVVEILQNPKKCAKGQDLAQVKWQFPLLRILLGLRDI